MEAKCNKCKVVVKYQNSLLPENWVGIYDIKTHKHYYLCDKCKPKQKKNN